MGGARRRRAGEGEAGAAGGRQEAFKAPASPVDGQCCVRTGQSLIFLPVHQVAASWSCSVSSGAQQILFRTYYQEP